MQLVLVLALMLLFGGKSGAPRPELTNSDMFEVLKYISGDNGEMDKIIKEAEQVSEIINAIAPIAASFGANNNNVNEPENCDTPPQRDIGLSLKPIANIADDSIYNALSNAIS